MYLMKNVKYRGVIDIKEQEINPGNIYIVSGPSGSGKSSLINLLMANDYEYSGEIFYNEVLLKKIDSMYIKKRVVNLSQDSVLLSKTIQGEFEELCKLLEIDFDIDKMKSSLKDAELDLELDFANSKLSGGQKQRLCIARTLYLDRETYIFDEPTSALDPETSQKIMDNLTRKAHETQKLFIIISHDLAVINNPSYEHIILGGNRD